MMDLDALREALERVPRYDLMLLSTDSPIVAAARAVLDSEEAWWCETHHAEGVHFCWKAAFVYAFPDDAKSRCSMVRRRLLAEEKL